MKSIIDICKDFGLEIPADKHADFSKAVAENYKTNAEFEKKVNRLTEDLEAEKKARKTAEDTLKGFDGKDFDAITRERDEWQRKHQQLEEEHRKEQDNREFQADVESAISEAKGKNTKAIMALLDLETLRGSKNRKADIAAALKTVQTDNEYLFDAAGAPPARFDDGGNKGNPGGGGNATVKEIMAIKDPVERQAKIVQNMHLFKKG